MLPFLWLSKGRLALQAQEGFPAPPRTAPSAGSRGTVVLGGSFPCPLSASPLEDLRLSLPGEQTLVQRNAASTPAPADGSLSRALLPSMGAGCRVLPPRAGSPPSARRPGSSLRRRPQRNFGRVAAPPLPPRSTAGRGGGQAGRRPPLARLPGGGGETGPGPSPPRPPPSRPRVATPARCLLSQALAADRRRLEFCPNRGAGGGVEEGRRPAARNGIRSPEPHGEERSGGGGGSGGSAAPARPQCISEAVRTCSGWLPPGSMHWLTGSQPPRDLF